MGTVRRVSRNVKYWRSPSMALRWAGAAMQEAAKGFKRLKAYKQLPLLQAALAVRKARTTSSNAHLAGSLPRDRLKISSACPCFSSVRARPFRSGDTPPHAERSTARGFRRRPQSVLGRAQLIHRRAPNAARGKFGHVESFGRTLEPQSLAVCQGLEGLAVTARQGTKGATREHLGGDHFHKMEGIPIN
jgi:hypothetical protein